MNKQAIEHAYELARERYAGCGVDTDAALERLRSVAISLHCWQGDDVHGFETGEGELTGGIQVTGSYPGRARTPDELRADIETALKLLPGAHRLNLHAIYAETDGTAIPRDELTIDHFSAWIDWAKAHSLGLDFNGTFFSHPLSADGFTLSHPEERVRAFWIRHAQACRTIGAEMGRALGTACVHNLWIPDGFKDKPADRGAYRTRLQESLDAIFAQQHAPACLRDAVECKLFGIGSESCVIGSHEFYMGYAVKNNLLLTLDTGHFHPTEVVSDKISAVLPYVPEILLHVSRGVRWDSDHVVTFSTDLLDLAAEIVQGDRLDRIHIGLDYFDASINRIAAWVIGTRAMRKALLVAMLNPPAIAQCEAEGDFTGRLAWQEEATSLPWSAVWDQFCLQENVPPGATWLEQVRDYETTIRAQR